MTVFSKTFDTATPGGSDDPAEADDRMREIKAAVQERENVDHYWPLTGTEGSDVDAGEHRKVTLRTDSAPTAVADKGFVYVKDISNKAELFYRDEDGNEVQLTSKGDNLANNTPLKSTDNAGTGSVNLIKATAGDIPEILVGAVLSADTAPAVDAGIVNKKYVEDFVGAYAKLVDSKAAGTDGGTATTGSWFKRTVAEETDVGNNVSVSSSVIVLAAGTYECRIVVPGFQVGSHQTRLRNTTAGSTVLVGTMAYATNGALNPGGDNSFIAGRFTIAASQNLEIQQRVAATKATDGLGKGRSWGEANIYTVAIFRKR